ncbi:hypothetical protein SAMN04487905_11315 [Actinopolyspora xinjiangensis]|uniref:Uncharacterized protein n=1 Tax=Actinopolyspora xinjiangensis TaxID=405564 RepID=A0A1H0WLX2_9ACTN|nr:hypothetical protein [Actinopolyspora xinjiangensis]SDP91628.1 hypothetical protein SAMN04487905_11315 [Actinopolyspora xinjiangensis]
MNFETPEWDAAEQEEPYAEDLDEPAGEDELTTSGTFSDANPADLAEQHIVVPDEEDYEHG